MKKQKLSPLGNYLKKHKISQARFIGIVEQKQGWSPHQGQLSRWVTGRNIPTILIQLELESATGGSVTPAKWRRYKRERSR